MKALILMVVIICTPHLMADWMDQAAQFGQKEQAKSEKFWNEYVNYEQQRFSQEEMRRIKEELEEVKKQLREAK